MPNRFLFEKEFVPVLDNLFHYAWHLTRDTKRAKDLLGTTAMRILAQMDKYRPGTNAETFGRTVMKRIFLHELRSQGREGYEVDGHVRAHHLAQFDQLLAWLSEGQEDVLLDDKLNNAVQMALNQLSDRERYILANSLAGVKNEDITQTLNTNVNILEAQLQRVYLKLIGELESFAATQYDIRIRRKV